MANTAYNAAVVMGMVVVGLTGTPGAVGAEPELLAVRILVINKAGVPPPDTLARAQTETARIYAAAGVGLVWQVQGAPSTAIHPADPLSLLPRLTMLIVSNPDAWPKPVAEDALGAAPGSANAVGRLAYAFHDRIEASAQRHGTDPAKILGYVMAHELGHLLLARGAHSFTGIMSGRWDLFQMHSVERSSLRFSNGQAKGIRSTVLAMNGNHRR